MNYYLKLIVAIAAFYLFAFVAVIVWLKIMKVRSMREEVARKAAEAEAERKLMSPPYIPGQAVLNIEDTQPVRTTAHSFDLSSLRFADDVIHGLGRKVEGEL